MSSRARSPAEGGPSRPLLLPGGLLARNVDVVGDGVTPRYLGSRDAPWLRALLDVVDAFRGKPKQALRERLREPLSVASPRASRLLAAHVLERLTQERPRFSLPPAKVRAEVFGAAAGVRGSRAEALARAGLALGVEAGQLDELLFADLPHAARVGEAVTELSPGELALEVNLALAASLLARASDVTVRAFGNTRAVVRHARLAGLICSVRSRDGAGEDVELGLSGPFALFRHTNVYGRALASLLPRLGWCQRYDIEARCALSRAAEAWTFRLSQGDPLPVGRELARFDSKLEARFAADFAKLGSDYELVREPEPVALGDGTLAFPDFALVHRHRPDERWLIELVGFWTTRYLERKLALVSKLGARYVLCIDEALACREDALPEHARVLRYRRRVDALRLLGMVSSAA